MQMDHRELLYYVKIFSVNYKTNNIKLHVVVFWVTTPCSDVVGCQRNITLQMEAIWSSETLESFHITTWHHNPA
jgi:hypothetical protein